MNEYLTECASITKNKQAIKIHKRVFIQLDEDFKNGTVDMFYNPEERTLTICKGYQKRGRMEDDLKEIVYSNAAMLNAIGVESGTYSCRYNADKREIVIDFKQRIITKEDTPTAKFLKTQLYFNRSAYDLIRKPSYLCIQYDAEKNILYLLPYEREQLLEVDDSYRYLRDPNKYIGIRKILRDHGVLYKEYLDNRYELKQMDNGGFLIDMNNPLKQREMGYEKSCE